MKAIPRKQRAMVRKGDPERPDLRGRTATSSVLHRIYAESVRNLGTPVFSRRYFRVLMEVFGERRRYRHDPAIRTRRSPR